MDYGYDFAGRPVSAGGIVTAAAYLPFGPLKTIQFANGTTQTVAYDERYLVTSNELTIDGLPPATGRIARYEYLDDAAGNITDIKDKLDPTYDRHFGYDDLNRLTSATTGESLWVTGTYEWDAMGNILRANLSEVVDGGPENLSAGSPKKFKPTDKPKKKKQASQTSLQPLAREMTFFYRESTPVIESVALNGLSRTVGHDPAGNETSYVVNRTYSARNYLAEVRDEGEPGSPVQTLAYSYDGRGLRVVRAESPSDGPGTTARRFFVYSPELQLLAATRDDGPNVWGGNPPTTFGNNVDYEIVWFGGRPVAQVVPGGSPLYTFTDHLGTPILQTDQARVTRWRVEYEPFGNVYEVREGTRTDQPLRFPGQDVAMTWEGPEESYNIFRWYGAGWGRYTQGDLIGAVRRRGSQLEANHPYGYVDGNPLRFIDPLGLVKWDCGVLIGTGNAPIGPGGGGMLATCRSECKNNKRVSVDLASGVLGLSAGPLPGGLSAFHATLEDGTDTPNAQNLVGLVVYGSVGAWVPLGGGCSNISLGRAQGNFGCSFTWFGGLDIGLDVYVGYSAIVDGPRESCCQ